MTSQLPVLSAMGENTSSAAILVVDDDPDTLQLLNDALTDAGYDVRLARDGASALRILLDNPNIGLVLVDFIMPNVNGAEVIHSLRLAAGASRVPIILISALAHVDQYGVLAGANDFIAKPFDIDTLLQKVGHWVNRQP